MVGMPMLAENCARCGVKNGTFDVLAKVDLGNSEMEIFCRCRACNTSTVFHAEQLHGNIGLENLAGDFVNAYIEIREVVFVVPRSDICPNHVPDDIRRIYDEAALCLAVGAWDASGIMFRKVLDAATRPLLPSQAEGDSRDDPNFIPIKVRRDLKLRLEWLIKNGKMREKLYDLIECIREDGNDAAHDTIGITKDEALDLSEFTLIALEELYTFPGQIEENKRRRAERRGRK